MRKITNYQIEDHGVEHSQYFQGCGTLFTPFNDVATGIGNSPAEALEDAIEQLGMNGWDVAELPTGWDEGMLKLTDDYVSSIICQCKDKEQCDCLENTELHYYVSLLVTDKVFESCAP